MYRKFDARREAIDLIAEAREHARQGFDLAEVVDNLLAIERQERTPAEYRQIRAVVEEVL